MADAFSSRSNAGTLRQAAAEAGRVLARAARDGSRVARPDCLLEDCPANVPPRTLAAVNQRPRKKLAPAGREADAGDKSVAFIEIQCWRPANAGFGVDAVSGPSGLSEWLARFALPRKSDGPATCAGPVAIKKAEGQRRPGRSGLSLPPTFAVGSRERASRVPAAPSSWVPGSHRC